ncbi:hypothetical protein [Sulfitobacter sp. R18_1]|uniref:hypothetical protein n=1 Tax=Sulfitobacter sp. R18_1 TaxID=2821104 RepID=UPI001ADBDC9F|nr:hypothetical protein [Sulfitobacter sp. R18_1]MBO9432363.1 hypothetical protein [Sulfitobacter sp. R18_1]
MESRELVFFDGVSTYGHANGIIQLDLTATRLTADKSGVTANNMPIGDLRCSITTAIALRDAINHALDMAGEAARQAASGEADPKPN